jgi:hypothetical protein
MLTCVFHPIDDFRVVEEDEAERLRASGVWFDSPTEAKQYRLKVENEIKEESKEEKPKTKSKGKKDERK